MEIYMNYFYLYIFFLVCFIIGMSYYNMMIEGFTKQPTNANAKTKAIVLLGDSILKNDAYVSDGKSVEHLVSERNKRMYGFAQDNSKIVDVYTQINQIPYAMDSPDTYIFLSVGGNDILTHYVEQRNDVNNTTILKTMFIAYKKVIKSIQTRLPKANLLLLDIYYPDNLRYKQFHSIIKQWNDTIYAFAKNPNNHIHGVIKISEQLTKPDDFSFGIEPSSIGGNKIANAIINII